MLFVTPFVKADWAVMDGVGASVTSKYLPSVFAASPKDKNIVLIYINAGCRLDDISYEVVPVNGTLVKMAATCLSDKQWVYGAYTDKGRLFLFNEFKSKNNVTVGPWEFSAKGFVKARKEAKSAL